MKHLLSHSVDKTQGNHLQLSPSSGPISLTLMTFQTAFAP